MAARATGSLAETEVLLLADLVAAECLYVLESFYEVERVRVAELLRAAIARPSIPTLDADPLLRALELYELDGLDFRRGIRRRPRRNDRCRENRLVRPLDRPSPHRHAREP